MQNIIFDLGGVLLDLKLEASQKAFQCNNRSTILPPMLSWMSGPLIATYEINAIDTKEFRSKIRELLINPELSDETIDAAWCAMLGNIPRRKFELLKDLKHKYRLFLFSNTNEMHVGHFEPQFEQQYGIPIQKMFDTIFYSHEIQDRKPNLSAFEKVIAIAKINPANTIFIDDNPDNVKAAAAAGLRAGYYDPANDLTEYVLGLV